MKNYTSSGLILTTNMMMVALFQYHMSENHNIL